MYNLNMIVLSDSEISEVISLINSNNLYEIPRIIPGFTFGRENLVSFLKDFYRNYRDLLGIDSVLYIVDFVNDKAFTKECIDIVFNNRNSNNYFRSDLNGLLYRFGSVDYIFEFIKKNRDQLSQLDLIDLCLFLIKMDKENSDNYAEYFIEKRNEFNLRPIDLVMIINGVSDDNFTKKYINERDKYGFDNKSLCLLIENVSDKDYILECLKHIQDFNIDETYLSNLLLFLNSPSRDVSKLLVNESIPLDKRVSLAISTKDQKLVDKIIKNRFAFDFSKEDMIKLLTFASKKFREDSIDNPAFYGLDSDLDLFPIYRSLGRDLKAKTIIRNRKLEDFEIPNKLKTPTDMFFGVELECAGLKSSSFIDYIFHPRWKGKHDGSILDGLEVTCPPSNNSQEFVNTLNKVTTILKKSGFFVNSSCGGHVHIDLSFFDDKRDVEKSIKPKKGQSALELEEIRSKESNRRTLCSLKNLLEIWNNNEDLFYIISNPEGEVTDKRRLFYASSSSKKWEDAIRSGNIDINSEEDLKEFKRHIKSSQKTKNVSLNIGEYGKHTIEFRLSNASLDPNIWMENISLYGGLVECCRNLTRIMIKDENERTPEEKEKLQRFSFLNTADISRDERIDLLIDMISQDEEQKVLLKKRYDVNSKLFDMDEDLSYYLNNKLAKRPLLFRPKDTYFTDIKSDEYMKVSSNIENELEKDNQVEKE